MSNISATNFLLSIDSKIIKYGLDRTYNLTCHFHKRRLTEDQDLYVREGDFILYGEEYYQIAILSEPKQLFGQETCWLYKTHVFPFKTKNTISNKLYVFSSQTHICL